MSFIKVRLKEQRKCGERCVVERSVYLDCEKMNVQKDECEES